MAGEEVRRVWSRRELEETVHADPDERVTLRVAVSAKLLLLLMDYQEEHRAERCELVMAYGNPMACELRFFYREDETS